MKTHQQGANTSPNRKLSAILFADIVGYTALMQSDETTANQLLDKFHNTINTKVILHKGQVINNYGDGCVCTFDSAVDAMNCAKEVQLILQTAPNVPVRIGLHSGDVLFKDNNVYGDIVNIASRIESFGIAGAILFSKRIKRDITNQTDFQVQSLGEFEFKNIEKKMEVFALANDGIVIPSQEELKGKGKQVDKQGSFFQRIWEKKIPQILTTYIFIAWLGLQLFDWALTQFGISPHWGQIFFISVLGIIPSLLVYLNNRDRIHESHLKLREKILFPTNFVLVGAVLFFMFRTADLGAVSTNISFINADGEKETRKVIKEEFKRKIPVFAFENLSPDSTDSPIGLMLHDAVAYDLNLNKYVAAVPLNLQRSRIDEKPFTTTEKINQAKIFNGSMYVDGTYDYLEDGQMVVTTMIRNSKNSNILKEQIFKGKNIFEFDDSLRHFLLQSVGLNKSQLEETIDISAKEAISDNIEAMEFYALGIIKGSTQYNLEKALEKDSTFAIAALRLAQHNHGYSKGSLENKAIIDQAMRHRKRLPFLYQIYIMMYKHMIYEEWEKAEELLQLQLEMDPANEEFNLALMNLYTITDQFEKAIALARKRFSKDIRPSSGFMMAQAALLEGKPGEIIKGIKPLLLLDPQNVFMLNLKAVAHIHAKEYDEARKVINKIILIDPEMDVIIAPLLKAIDYMEAHPDYYNSYGKWLGNKKSINGEQLWDFKMIDNQLYGKVSNQPGNFFYPDSDSSFVFSLGFSSKFVGGYTESGSLKEIKITQQNKGRKSFYNYMWVYDDLIEEAEDLIWKKDYSNAAIAYDKAIEKHPEHYFLKGMKKHLEYLQSKPEAEIQMELEALVGDYKYKNNKDVKLWLQDGLLYYKRLGIPRRILRPIGNNQFVNLLGKHAIYQVDMQNGKPKGIFISEYDRELKDYKRNEDWYLEKVVIKN